MSVEIKSELPLFPNGWFLACLSSELKPGQILTRMFSGHEVVIYRTESGKPVMAGAYCPHMGAHFGHGGKVEGELVVCPFHGFCFDPSGKCVKTGYGTPPPPQAKIKTWHLREQNGLILAWHHDKVETPYWEIPVLDEENWTPPRFHKWTLNTNPFEIAENSVDIGHFSLVHGYSEVGELRRVSTEGPWLNARYAMSRMTTFVGIGGKKLHIEFEANQWGVGYALAEAHVVEYGLDSRHFVFPSAMDGKEVSLTIAVSLRKDFNPGKINPFLKIIPKPLLLAFMMKGYHRNYIHDVYDDFKIWRNKVYVHPPALAKGDGPVIPYRKWAMQFYPGDVLATVNEEKVPV